MTRPMRSVRALPPWEHRLKKKIIKGGEERIEATHSNAILMMRHHPSWRGVLRCDEMTGETMICQPPPWGDDVAVPGASVPRPWASSDAGRAVTWFATTNDWIQMGAKTIAESVDIVAQASPYHPIRDYLRGLTWDGLPRIDALASKYLGCHIAPEYANRVTRMWLISAVARVMKPGCQADYVLILEGGQGAGKSSACRTLFGDDHFLGSAVDIRSKDGMHILRGMWGVELAELDSVARSSPAAAKAFLTSRVDRYRPPYEARVISVPRQCVYVGSVNKHAGGYLEDETGNRRYWPIDLTGGEIDLAGLSRDRDQVWAEALAEYDDGRPWWPDATMIPELTEQQSERSREDVWQHRIGEWISSQDAARRAESRGGGVLLADVLEQCIGIEPAKQTTGEAVRAGKVLTKLGCKSRRVGKHPNRVQVYSLPDPADDVPD